MDALLGRRAVRVGLIVLAIVAASSMGGGFVAGIVLVPLLMLASRHVSTAAATGIGVLAAVLIFEIVWALVHLLAGEQQPYIWLLPAVGATATIAATIWMSRTWTAGGPRDNALA